MSFGKNRLVRDGDKALIAFSGGLCSTALLHLVLEVMIDNTEKRIIEKKPYCTFSVKLHIVASIIPYHTIPCN